MQPGETRRFFFIHVQKAAGTSLFSRLQHQFGKRAVYPDRSDGAERIGMTLSVRDLRERFQARRDDIRVVTGHFPLCATEVLDARFTTLTVLREPVERTLSYLRHHRQVNPEDRGKSLEEIYLDPWRFDGLLHNHMTKVFSLTTEETSEWDRAIAEAFSVEVEDTAQAWVTTKVEFTPERLELAKQGLASVDAMGLQQRFEEFCDDLSDRFGWDLGAPRYEARTQPEEVSEAFRARIAEDNAMDIELYEFAERLYEERRAAARLCDAR